MKTLHAITLLGCLALQSLSAVDPLSATNPLFLAIRAGDAAKVGMLLKNARAVDARDDYGSTPLMAAAWTADATVMERLLTAGADVNASNKAGVSHAP